MFREVLRSQELRNVGSIPVERHWGQGYKGISEGRGCPSIPIQAMTGSSLGWHRIMTGDEL